MDRSSNYIFLYGISVRSGTNFCARIFSKHPNVEVLPRNETIREFPFLKFSNSFKKTFENFSKTYSDCNGVKDDYDWERFQPYLGNAMLNYIDDHHVLDKSKRVFIKDPGVKNIEDFFKFFPKAKLIILIRDGRDLVESSEKGYLAKRDSQTLLNRVKRYVLHFSGREFRRNTDAWIKNMSVAMEFSNKSENLEKVFTVRYEDLANEDERVFKELFSFCELDFKPEIFKNVEIIGSSFTNEIKEDSKNKIEWKPIEKTNKFKPIGRWEKWPKWKKAYFKTHGSEALVKGGYKI